MRANGTSIVVALVGVTLGCGHPAPGPAPQSVGFPDAAVGTTKSLTFHVAVRSTESSVEGQARAALDDLLRRDRGARIVRLRVFAVGSERLVMAQRVIGETLAARHIPLPALSLLGVQSLPGPGQLIEMESIGVGTRAINPHGLAFLAGLASPTGEKTAAGLARVARAAGVSPTNVVRVSCFYESAEQLDGARKAVADTFPGAEAAFVQSYGSAATPAVECEAVARLADTVGATRYFNLPGTTPSPNFSRAALVSASQLAFTGTVVALGDSASDMHVLLDRVQTSLTPLGGTLHDVAMAGNYWLTGAARDALRPARNEAYGSTVPAATGVFMTSLAPVNGTVALELTVPLR
jgi:enamine deaminase RidA (YjgF/YER057c/UK114 family)